MPVPVDDGAADHLVGLELPAVTVVGTDGDVRLDEWCGPRAVLFVHPGIGGTGELDLEEWKTIPGAFGCTAQSCGFAANIGAFRQAGAQVAGLSVLGVDRGVDATERLHLPYPLFSDPERVLAEAPLRLPLVDHPRVTAYRRLTLLVRDGRVDAVRYPVPSPGDDWQDALSWLST